MTNKEECCILNSEREAATSLLSAPKHHSRGAAPREGGAPPPPSSPTLEELRAKIHKDFYVQQKRARVEQFISAFMSLTPHGVKKQFHMFHPKQREMLMVQAAKDIAWRIIERGDDTTFTYRRFLKRLHDHKLEDHIAPEVLQSVREKLMDWRLRNGKAK